CDLIAAIGLAPCDAGGARVHEPPDVHAKTFIRRLVTRLRADAIRICFAPGERLAKCVDLLTNRCCQKHAGVVQLYPSITEQAIHGPKEDGLALGKACSLLDIPTVLIVVSSQPEIDECAVLALAYKQFEQPV